MILNKRDEKAGEVTETGKNIPGYNISRFSVALEKVQSIRINFKDYFSTGYLH